MDTWDKMKKAKEDSYFEKKNQEALERLRKSKENQIGEKPRLSPITGEPMIQEVLHGVVIDRCEKTGGIWLDAGELEQLVQEMKDTGENSNWLSSLFGGLSTTKDH